MSGSRVIGSGTARNFRWTLEAGGDDSAYWTGLKVSGPDDYRCSGGMAGPKLGEDGLINAYSVRNDRGPLGIAVRASSTVTRIVVRSGDGGEAELPCCGQRVIDGLRFYAGLVWPDQLSSTSGLDELRAVDESGSLAATYDLSFWDRPSSR